MPRRWSFVRAHPFRRGEWSVQRRGRRVSNRGSGNLNLRLSAALVCSLLAPLGAARAACVSPISINVGPALQNYGITCDGSASAYGNIAIVDGSNAANKATVNASLALLVAQTGALPAGANIVGKLDLLGNAGGAMDAAGQNAVSPANSLLIGGQFNTTPTTLTTGNMSPLQLDNAGNLLVKVNAGTLTVSGTVAVTGVATAANQTSVQAVIGAGTAPASMNVSGGQYRATPLTLTDLQSSALQLGVNGGLVIDPTNITLASSSTTSGQRGSMSMCATTTGNPSYTTAQTNYCSLTTSGALRSDMTSIGGTAVDTNSGVKSAGTIRQVIATDQPNLTTPLNVRLTDGTNPSVFTASAASALTTNAALVVAASPNPTAVCPNRIAINQTASADVLTSTNKIYICSIDLLLSGTETVSIIEGTGTVCATGTAALWGGTTADATHGMPFSNGGFSKTADRPFAQTLTTADHLCILKSGSGLLSGAMWYVDHT